MNLSWVTDLLKNPEVMGTIAGKLHKLGVGYNLDSVASGLTIGSALEPFIKNPTLGKDTPGKMDVPKGWIENLTGKALLGINPEGETPYNFDINSFMGGSPIGMNVNQALENEDWGAYFADWW